MAKSSFDPFPYLCREALKYKNVESFIWAYYHGLNGNYWRFLTNKGETAFLPSPHLMLLTSSPKQGLEAYYEKHTAIAQIDLSDAEYGVDYFLHDRDGWLEMKRPNIHASTEELTLFQHKFKVVRTLSISVGIHESIRIQQMLPKGTDDLRALYRTARSKEYLASLIMEQRPEYVLSHS